MQQWTGGHFLSVFQINEAFASQFAYCVDQLGVPIEKINPKWVSPSF
jgi:acetyl-CoA acetyltransferase